MVVSATAKRPENLVYYRANTTMDFEKVFKLRYQVYVIERGMEKSEDHPNERETDIFDKNSVHFICEKNDGTPIGTSRIILPSPIGYPIQRHFTISINNGENTAEISRLAVSKFYRHENNGVHPINHSTHTDQQTEHRDPSIGLLKEMFQFSKVYGIEYVYTAMEEKLLRLLRHFGFRFQQIGQYKDYHGWRAPFIIQTSKVESEASRFLEIIDYRCGT